MNEIITMYNNRAMPDLRSPVHQRFLKVCWDISTQLLPSSRLDYKGFNAFNFKNCEPIEPIVKLGPTHDTFAELCDKRAMELVAYAKAQNKPLKVMWSGGLDSTTIVCALLRTTPPEELKNMTMLMSTESIVEYPLFYKKFIIPNFKVQSSRDDFINCCDRGNSIVVTGEVGDQIFGSNVVGYIADMFNDQDITSSKNYKDISIKYWTAKVKTNDPLGDATKYFNAIEPIISKCPFPIDTLHDFQHWWSITHKWQHVKYRMVMLMDEADLPVCLPSMIHFFDTPPFQQWAIYAPPELKTPGGYPTHKHAMKLYCVETAKDPEYMKKQKMNSLYALFWLKNQTFTYDENFKKIPPDQLYQYINKDLNWT